MSQALAFQRSYSSHAYDLKSASSVRSEKYLYNQQIIQLYSLAPYGIVASLINASIICAILWQTVQQVPLVSWLASIFIINALWSLLLYWYHQRRVSYDTSLHIREKWFIGGNLASGCLWGVGGILLSPSNSIGHEIFLTFAFGGMVAGATALYASHFPAFLAFSLPTALPLTLQFFFRGDSLHTGMGIMGCLFIAVMVMTAKRNNSMLIESLTLYQENSTLIRNLTRSRDLAENLNDSLSKEVANRAAIEEELRKHQEQLETLVDARTAALQASESRYRFVTENISDVIWMMEPDGHRFSYVSPSVKELRGYSAKEVMAMSLDECLTPASLETAQSAIQQELERLMDQPRQQGPHLSLELEHLRKDGSTVWAEVRASLLLDEEGQPLGFAGVTRDLTERRKIDHEKHQLETQLLRSQKMDAIGTLAGGIAHDFNNLLTSILGNITLTQHMMKLPPLGETYLQRAEQATERAKDLTRQLLAFSKGGEPIKQLISLKDIIVESSSFALSGSSVLRELDLAVSLWPIEADPGQVSQIIHNIGINAVQAMPTGGKLSINAANMWIDQSSRTAPTQLLPGPYVHVTLSDNGMGIPKEQLDKIFEPYFSTKPEGQGLGLATTYAIMQKHTGQITVESQLEVGTTFSLYFPACASGAQPLKLEALPLHHGSGKILVMDDEESIRLLAKEMLSHCGYQSVFAKDGYETLALYQQAIDMNTPFSAVILDLTVPGGLGGKETIRRLREINPHVMAFVSSGFSNDPIMANYETYGFHGVIAKPYSLIGLSTILHQHLSGTSLEVTSFPPQPGTL
mgnify:CR=1 FL=1